MQENLKKKYSITDEELRDAINQLKLANIACDYVIVVALCDLLANGDIAPQSSDE